MASGRQAPKLGGGTVDLADGAFGARFHEPLVHEAVRAELNARRQGTAAGKSCRNSARVNAMPVADAGVADVIGAASLLVSEAALPALVARASKEEAES